MTPAQPDRLDRIEILVEENAKAISQLKDDLKAESRKWDERSFQLTRNTLGTAKTIIVTAGTVVILSLLLQALSPAIYRVHTSLERFKIFALAPLAPQTWGEYSPSFC